MGSEQPTKIAINPNHLPRLEPIAYAEFQDGGPAAAPSAAWWYESASRLVDRANSGERKHHPVSRLTGVNPHETGVERRGKIGVNAVEIYALTPWKTTR